MPELVKRTNSIDFGPPEVGTELRVFEVVRNVLWSIFQEGDFCGAKTRSSIGDHIGVGVCCSVAGQLEYSVFRQVQRDSRWPHNLHLSGWVPINMFPGLYGQSTDHQLLVMAIADASVNWFL